MSDPYPPSLEAIIHDCRRLWWRDVERFVDQFLYHLSIHLKRWGLILPDSEQ